MLGSDTMDSLVGPWQAGRRVRSKTCLNQRALGRQLMNIVYVLLSIDTHGLCHGCSMSPPQACVGMVCVVSREGVAAAKLFTTQSLLLWFMILRSAVCASLRLQARYRAVGPGQSSCLEWSTIQAWLAQLLSSVQVKYWDCRLAKLAGAAQWPTQPFC